MITSRIRRRPAPQRSAKRYEPSGQILIRRSEWYDATALRQLAELDSRPLPPGAFLLAEVADELVAAVPLEVQEEPISNPFEPTADIVELLRLYARKLRRNGLVAQRVEVTS